MSRDLSWSELAELTHVTQIEHFNFCLCEDNEGREPVRRLSSRRAS
jgi:hypothetical protein